MGVPTKTGGLLPVVGLGLSWCFLMCALPENHCGYRSDEDPEVKEQGGVLNVFYVELHPVFKTAYRASATDLPEAGDSGLHTEAPAMGALFDPLGFIVWERSWADQTHLSAQYIHKLGNLIKTVTPQKAAYWCHSWIHAKLENWALHLVMLVQCGMEFRCILHHGAEFQDGEASPPFPIADLPEDYRAR